MAGFLKLRYVNKLRIWLKRPMRLNVISIISYIYDLKNKYLFEKKYDLDFGNNVSRSRLVSNSSFLLSHAMAYQPFRIFKLNLIFKKINKFGFNFQNFVDIGSGTGKVCVYVASLYKFNKIIGVEFSAPLAAMAKKNISKIKSGNITVLNEDASAFNMPIGNNFVFLFNPFDEVILGRLLLNNMEHFKNNNSVMVYANDLHRDTLDNAGFEQIYRDNILEYSVYMFADRWNELPK